MILSLKVWRLCENCVAVVRGSMFEHWDYILTQIISTFGSVASVTAYQAMQDEKNKISGAQVNTESKQNEKSSSSKTKSRMMRFIHRFKYLLIILAIVIILIFGIEFIKELTDKNEPSLDPKPTILPLENQGPITSWPIKRSAKDRWLDEMDAKVSNYSAFFIDEWDGFDEVSIKHKKYPHSIGVKIPIEDLIRYRTKIGVGQLEHIEYIEYSLAFEYDTLQFDFGIDDLSFPKGVAEHPMCLFKIIVDVCDSESFYSSKQNHVFETDWLNDQCCLRRTSEMDVSGHESVRITIIWQFSPRDDGPMAFNLAIVNPILRAEKLRNSVISNTKPDSIR